MRKVLVTGATSGIGRALVTQLRQRQIQVIAVARDAARLEVLAAEGVGTYACDLAKAAQIEAVFPLIWREHPDVDTLINNAGVQFTPGFLSPDFNDDTITEEVAVNLLAPIRLTVLSLPYFLGREGTQIVNIGSGLAFFPKTGSAVYCATKAAIRSFSQSLRYQLEGTGIGVTEVILPLVDTPMTAGRGGKGKLAADTVAREILRGLKARKPEIFVGKARLIPFLARVAPSVLRRMLKRSG